MFTALKSRVGCLRSQPAMGEAQHHGKVGFNGWGGDKMLG